MALTKLDVKGIKDGTDGQLITWDASAVADTVATGGTTQVLTSNGAGANVKYKIETLNQSASKDTRVYGTSMAWA